MIPGRTPKECQSKYTDTLKQSMNSEKNEFTIQGTIKNEKEFDGKEEELAEIRNILTDY